jgi:hypothetical protein
MFRVLARPEGCSARQENLLVWPMSLRFRIVIA